jgi:predicted metal-dependent hydrolase
MAEPTRKYEPLYLAGVVLFNRREFFEAHEVLEDLWNECPSGDRRFYQAVLQAAVALHHFGNGNLRGAVKLYRTAKEYMELYPNPAFGLDREKFWSDMAVCFEEVHREGQDLLRRDLRPNPDLIPTITLDPPPTEWPDPDQYLRDDHD